jgi:hypothetical protein
MDIAAPVEGPRFMVSLSNHEAARTVARATPSWFDRLTMKSCSDESPQ